jgi:flagellar hook-associated protein 3 FlgL
MDITFTSTKSTVEAARSSVLKMQRQLVVAQKEVASGRYADVGIALGTRTTRSISMRRDINYMNLVIDTNSTAATRLDSTQSTLTSLTEMAQSFVDVLITARATETGRPNALNEAKANLSMLTDVLNSAMGGESLFAGIKTDTMPLADYFASPTSAAKTAVDAAFLAEFGTTQSDPANETGISGTDMQTFLDTTFHTLFNDANWAANWSTASDENVVSRISVYEEVETSSNANYLGYRKMAEAFTMVADLGIENLNDLAFQAIVDTAIDMVGEATQYLAVEQGRLGTSQERIELANERLMSQISIITEQVNGMEVVDPYDAATRVTTLLTQLETSYALTARIQKLTILNYI